MDDLYNLISKDKANYSFNSERTGYQLAVQIPAQFEVMKENNDDSLLFCKVKLMHSGENRNHSSVTDNALIKASKTLAYKPVLANFMEYTDENSGEKLKDFTSHDMELDDDNNIVYIEKQVGCFTSDDAFFEVEKETGHNFLYGYCAIPRDYTAAASIIERKGGTKISVELGINEMQYNASSNVLELTDVTITGATLLGKNAVTLNNVEEGMKNARVDLLDFSEENNSLFSSVTKEEQSKLIETLEALNKTLSSLNIDTFNKEDFEKGGSTEKNMKFEELLSKYNKTVEDITFEYDSLTDEELEAKFEEEFGTDEPEADPEDPEGSSEPEGDPEEPEEPESPEADPEPENGTESFSKVFSLSHEDLRSSLYRLLEPIEMAENDCYWIVSTYDDYFIYESYMGNYFKQKFTTTDDVVAFNGDRESVFAEFVTETELAELNSMRDNYSSIQEKLAKYEEAEDIADKMTVFEDEAYGEYLETDEFKALMKKDVLTKFSKEELVEKADAALGKLVKTHKTFAMNTEPEVKNKPTVLPFAITEHNSSFLDGLLKQK